MKFVSEVLVDTQMIRDVNQLMSRHAFSDTHKTKTKLRIETGKLMKEIKGIGDELKECGY